MAQEGAQVAIADINDQGGQETVAQIGERGGLLPHTDVSSNTEVQSLVEDTVARFGAIDILVNNAAIVLFKRLIDTEPDEWDKVIATNLRSVYLCSRYTIPHMMRRGRWSNCQYLIGASPRYYSAGLELRCQQGSDRLFDPEYGAGICEPRHPGELCAAGRHRHSGLSSQFTGGRQ